MGEVPGLNADLGDLRKVAFNFSQFSRLYFGGRGSTVISPEDSCTSAYASFNSLGLGHSKKSKNDR